METAAHTQSRPWPKPDSSTENCPRSVGFTEDTGIPEHFTTTINLQTTLMSTSSSVTPGRIPPVICYSNGMQGDNEIGKNLLNDFGVLDSGGDNYAITFEVEDETDMNENLENSNVCIAPVLTTSSEQFDRFRSNTVSSSNDATAKLLHSSGFTFEQQQLESETASESVNNEVLTILPLEDGNLDQNLTLSSTIDSDNMWQLLDEYDIEQEDLDKRFGGDSRKNSPMKVKSPIKSLQRNSPSANAVHRQEKMNHETEISSYHGEQKAQMRAASENYGKRTYLKQGQITRTMRTREMYYQSLQGCTCQPSADTEAVPVEQVFVCEGQMYRLPETNVVRVGNMEFYAFLKDCECYISLALFSREVGFKVSKLFEQQIMNYLGVVQLQEMGDNEMELLRQKCNLSAQTKVKELISLSDIRLLSRAILSQEQVSLNEGQENSAVDMFANDVFYRKVLSSSALKCSSCGFECKAAAETAEYEPLQMSQGVTPAEETFTNPQTVENTEMILRTAFETEPVYGTAAPTVMFPKIVVDTVTAPPPGIQTEAIYHNTAETLSVSQNASNTVIIPQAEAETSAIPQTAAEAIPQNTLEITMSSQNGGEIDDGFKDIEEEICIEPCAVGKFNVSSLCFTAFKIEDKTYISFKEIIQCNLLTLNKLRWSLTKLGCSPIIPPDEIEEYFRSNLLRVCNTLWVDVVDLRCCFCLKAREIPAHRKAIYLKFCAGDYRFTSTLSIFCKNVKHTHGKFIINSKLLELCTLRPGYVRESKTEQAFYTSTFVEPPTQKFNSEPAPFVVSSSRPGRRRKATTVVSSSPDTTTDMNALPACPRNSVSGRTEVSSACSNLENINSQDIYDLELFDNFVDTENDSCTMNEIETGNVGSERRVELLQANPPSDLVLEPKNQMDSNVFQTATKDARDYTGMVSNNSKTASEITLQDCSAQAYDANNRKTDTETIKENKQSVNNNYKPNEERRVQNLATERNPVQQSKTDMLKPDRQSKAGTPNLDKQLDVDKQSADEQIKLGMHIAVKQANLDDIDLDKQSEVDKLSSDEEMLLKLTHCLKPGKYLVTDRELLKIQLTDLFKHSEANKSVKRSNADKKGSDIQSTEGNTGSDKKSNKLSSDKQSNVSKKGSDTQLTAGHISSDKQSNAGNPSSGKQSNAGKIRSDRQSKAGTPNLDNQLEVDKQSADEQIKLGKHITVKLANLDEVDLECETDKLSLEEEVLLKLTRCLNPGKYLVTDSEHLKKQITDLYKHSEATKSDKQSNAGKKGSDLQSTAGNTSSEKRSIAGKKSSDKLSTAQKVSSDKWSDVGKISPSRQSNAGKISPDRQSNAGKINLDKQSNAGKISPDRQSNAGKISPDRQSNAGKISPDRQSNAGMISPDKQSNAGKISPERQSNVGKISPDRQSNAGKMSPDRQSNVGKISPDKQSNVGKISPDRQSNAGKMSPDRQSNVGKSLTDKLSLDTGMLLKLTNCLKPGKYLVTDREQLKKEFTESEMAITDKILNVFDKKVSAAQTEESIQKTRMRDETKLDSLKKANLVRTIDNRNPSGKTRTKKISTRTAGETNEKQVESTGQNVSVDLNQDNTYCKDNNKQTGCVDHECIVSETVASIVSHVVANERTETVCDSANEEQCGQDQSFCRDPTNSSASFVSVTTSVGMPTTSTPIISRHSNSPGSPGMSSRVDRWYTKIAPLSNIDSPDVSLQMLATIATADAEGNSSDSELSSNNERGDGTDHYLNGKGFYQPPMFINLTEEKRRALLAEKKMLEDNIKKFLVFRITPGSPPKFSVVRFKPGAEKTFPVLFYPDPNHPKVARMRRHFIAAAARYMESEYARTFEEVKNSSRSSDNSYVERRVSGSESNTQHPTRQATDSDSTSRTTNKVEHITQKDGDSYQKHSGKNRGQKRKAGDAVAGLQGSKKARHLESVTCSPIQNRNIIISIAASPCVRKTRSSVTMNSGLVKENDKKKTESSLLDTTPRTRTSVSSDIPVDRNKKAEIIESLDTANTRISDSFQNSQMKQSKEKRDKDDSLDRPSSRIRAKEINPNDSSSGKEIVHKGMEIGTVDKSPNTRARSSDKFCSSPNKTNEHKDNKKLGDSSCGRGIRRNSSPNKENEHVDNENRSLHSAERKKSSDSNKKNQQTDKRVVSLDGYSSARRTKNSDSQNISPSKRNEQKCNRSRSLDKSHTGSRTRQSNSVEKSPNKGNEPKGSRSRSDKSLIGNSTRQPNSGKKSPNKGKAQKENIVVSLDSSPGVITRQSNSMDSSAGQEYDQKDKNAFSISRISRVSDSLKDKSQEEKCGVQDYKGSKTAGKAKLQRQQKPTKKQVCQKQSCQKGGKTDTTKQGKAETLGHPDQVENEISSEQKRSDRKSSRKRKCEEEQSNLSSSGRSDRSLRKYRRC